MSQDILNEMRRQLAACSLSFIVTFDIVLTAWMIEEAHIPGQQYADPLLPCAFVASLGAQVGLAIYYASGIATAVSRRLKARQREKQMKIYAEAERGRYEPPACPGCHVRVEQAWINVGTNGNADRWTPGLWNCNTAGCKYGPPMIEVER